MDTTTLFVNLYIASELDWAEKGFKVTQETAFPKEGASRLTIHGSGALDINLRVPTWVRKGFSVTVNGEDQGLEAIPGTYLTLSRRWDSGDRIDIAMPLTYRVERAIDDPSVQSIYYGPTLLAVQNEPVGEDLESGLMELSLYRYMKLDGSLDSAFVPAGDPMSFSTNGLTLAPFYVSDPVPPGWEPPEPDPDSPSQGRGRRSPPTQPYHIYVRRREPGIVFGSVDSGVPNPTGPDGLTFLDAVWASAPFENHETFLSVVAETAAVWEEQGLLPAAGGSAIMEAARRAAGELRV